MKPTTFILGLLVAAALTSQVLAQQKYTLSNSSITLYKDRNGVALDNQNPITAGNGQGQLVQLGYFSTATDSNLFSGNFIPLAQFNSGDSSSGTTNIPNGRISLTVQFDLSLQATNFPASPAVAGTLSYAALNSYPAAGAPLAIRWYDTTNTSGFYNSVSATNWDWVSPTNISAASIVLNPDAASFPVGLAFQSAANPYVATIPEASTFACVGMGLFMLVTIRRFRRA